MADNRKSVRHAVSVRLLMALVALMMMMGPTARGAAVDSASASTFVRNWLASAQGDLGSGAVAGEPEEIRLTDGPVLAYVFNLSPQGYVVLSADDRVAPVIAVGGQGRFSIDSKSPAYAFLVTNLSGRLKYLNEKVSETRGGELPEAVEANRKEWAEYASPTRANMKPVISEIWVDSFIQSKWSQADCVYNYYTPTIYDTTYTFANPGSADNLVCGCVATGTAQLMRYFQWPQKKIGKKTGSCTINYRDTYQADPASETITRNLRGGNGSGGAYRWDLMPLEPSLGNLSDAERQQIGALCFDAGLSVVMSYNANNGNESEASFNPETLMSLFGYANARPLVNEEECRANLDARRPVAVSIKMAVEQGGHAILCDGYGRMGGRWYYHLNMGWAGSYDGWYNFDENYFCGSVFTGCAFSIGNVFRQPLQQGEALKGGQILSGRIVDANGKPVQGVRVALKKQGQVEDVEFLTMLAWYDPIDPNVSITADWDEMGDKDGSYDPEERPGAEKFRNCTDANGIWAIDKIEPGNYYVVLSKDGLQFRGDVDVSISSSNIWGKDFIAVPEGDATANLELKNWYSDGANMLWLEFNRALGNASIDLAKITVNGKNLEGAIIYQAADSTFVAIDCDGMVPSIGADSTLTIAPEAITIPTITDNATIGTDSGKGSGTASAVSETGNHVNITVPVTKKTVAGTDGLDSMVTAISRAPKTRFDISARSLTFVVEGGMAASLDDFKVSATKSWGINAAKPATEPPAVTLDSFDGTNLKVTVGQGDGYVRVDYVPADGAPFLTGEVYHVDNIGPAIIRADLSQDNKYVDVTWNENIVRNEPAYGTFTGRKATDDQAVYAYDGNINLGSNFALWMCGADRTKVGNKSYNAGDVALSGKSHPPVGVGYTDKLVDVKTTILTKTYTLGKFYYIDSNDNDIYDEGEGVFLNMLSNLDELKENPFAPEAFEPFYDPNREGDFDRKGWLFGTRPSSKTPAKELAISKGAQVYYYNEKGSKPKYTGMDVDAILTSYSNWLSTSSMWLDFQPATPHAYNPALDTLIISKGQNDKATAFTEVTAEICYLDLEGAGRITSGSFIWFDADGDGCYDTEKTSTPRDVILSNDVNALAMRGINQDDLEVILHSNGGTVTDVRVYAVTATDVTTRPTEDEIAEYALPYGTRKVRVWLAYTPELEQNVEYAVDVSDDELVAMTDEQRQSSKVPMGVETIEIRPAVNAVFDSLGNVSPTSNSTDEMLLYDTNQPRIMSAVMRYDNMGIQLMFNKRIYGNATGVANYQPGAKEYEVLNVGNFNVYVVYDDGTKILLNLPANGEYSTSKSVEYALGSSYCEINLFNAANAQALLNTQDGLYDKIDTVTRKTDFSNGKFRTVTTVTYSYDDWVDVLDASGNKVESRLYDTILGAKKIVQYKWGGQTEKIEYDIHGWVSTYKDANDEVLLTVDWTDDGKINDYKDASDNSVAKKDEDGEIERDAKGNALLDASAYQPHVEYAGSESNRGNCGTYKYQKPSADATHVMPVQLYIEFMEIYDLYGTQLAQKSLTIDLVPAYTRGLKKPTLPPAMFTKGADPAYTHVYLRGDMSTINKEPTYSYTLSNSVRGLPWITGPTDTTSGQTTTTKYDSSVRMANVLDPGAEEREEWKVAYSEVDAETMQTTNTLYGVNRTQYGVFYRDLDGDGRVDAVDLNFKNPYRVWDGSSIKYSAELTVTSTAGFRVWVQNNDPNDLDNATKKYFPPEKELPGTEKIDPDDSTKTITSNGWEDAFGPCEPYFGDTLVDADNKDPQQSNSRYWNMRGFLESSKHNFNANWSDVRITGYELKPSRFKSYTTLRLKLDQASIPPRTHGDRWIMLAYEAPKYSSKTKDVTALNDKLSYNWLISGGAAPAKIPETTTMPTYYNTLTAAQTGYYGNSDEEAGIYWKVSQSSRTETTDSARYSFIPAYFMVDTFGPVVAWDGAEPVPVAATTWHAQAYQSASIKDSVYEYMDVAFSEPIAYAMDKGASGFGYDSSNTHNGVLYGAWGVEFIDETTLRFKRSSKIGERTFAYRGKMAPKNGGYSVYMDTRLEESYDKRAVPVSKNFSLTAVGILPNANSRYRVLGHDAASSRIDMFTVDASDASITNNTVYDTTEFDDSNTSTFTLQYTSGVLNAYSQGGGWTGNTALWYADDARLGTTGTSRTHNSKSNGLVTYSLLSNTGEVTPGAGMYGGISAVTVTNETINAMTGSNLAYMIKNKVAFEAPSPLDRFNGFSTSLTPKKAVLAGPVYDMVKASAMKIANNTARIQAGKTYDVIGIDCASNASHKLESIRVRFVDVSYGQFDPVIDLEPMADTSDSGVQLVDAAGNVIKISTDSREWSAWGRTEAGLPYREVTLRLLAPQELPTVGGNANSFDFIIRIKTSENFNLGDNFYVEIPDDGIAFNTGTTKDAIPETWGILNGTKGFPFNDCRYYDKNGNGRWDEGEPITNTEDPSCLLPIYDGGYPYNSSNANAYLLDKNGITVRNLFYAKKEWATNPETYPFTSYDNGTVLDPAGAAGALSGTNGDYEFNVSYVPGDAIWYEVGGTYGVYDEGIDLPLFGNADKFVLPWQIGESGARSAQLRAAAPVITHSAENKYISAPSNEPVAVVGLNMQDAGRGFGPRYILEQDILIESISKNIAGSTYTLSYKNGEMAWKEVNEASFSSYTALPANKNERKVIVGKNGMFIVVRNLTGKLPQADTEVPFIVSKDIDRDIQQPSAIKGVRIHAVGRGNDVNVPGIMSRNGTMLSWNNGVAVDVADSGLYTLNAEREDYIIVEVTSIGGAVTESLNVYEADGRNITPFLNISGVEIMAVSDMTPMGFYTFSYDGAGNLSWNSGEPVSVNGREGDVFVLNGDSGLNNDYARTFVVVRRTKDSLPSKAVTERLYINQTQLLKVDVTLTNVLGITSSHFTPMSNDENSGISLWWDANADGKFNSSDMFVKLLEAPVLKGSGNTYTCTLTPDPSFLTAWLSCPQDVSTSVTGSNFFVCVKTTVDMSYGDIFSVTAKFYEPTEADNGGVCFASQGSGNITCSSITNTVIKKLTTAGQTVDANTKVKLFSIDHFLGTREYSEEVYITAVTVTLRGLNGITPFDPETSLNAMNEAEPEKRGIVLYKYGKNGAADALIESYINITHEEGTDEWTYKLLPVATGGDSNVPSMDDGSPDHYIAINMSEILPYGISFNATMSTVAVEYKTGVGSAGAAVTTDALTSTIATKYVDLLGSRMVTSMSGLVVNGFGASVANGYHNISIGYRPASDTYSLTWEGNSVDIDITQKAQYTLGSGENSITITFDPEAFFREDTPVNGLPPAGIKKGDKLVNVIKDSALTYYDENGDGCYSQGELIARDGEEIYQVPEGTVMSAAAVSKFTYADHLAFFDANGNGILDKGEIIFHDTDEQYLLPWMDYLVDNDNYVTAGKGGASSITAGDKLVDASTVSIAAGDKAPNTGLYLYYVDVLNDGRGFDIANDVLVARALNAREINPEMVFGMGTDKVVFDPLFGSETDDGQPMETDVDGKPLVQLNAMDYLRFRLQGADEAAMATYEQGKAIFFSMDNEYSLPEFRWIIRIDKERTIRRYEANAPAPFNRPADKDDVGYPTNDYALTAIIGLDIANGGATDVKLTSVKVRFNNVRGFTTSDLRPLSTDITSGVQLWRDMDGNGSFDADIDRMLPLGGTPAWTSDTTDNYLVLSPASGNEISSESIDNVYDFFVVVQADPTANSLQQYNYGDKCDQFKAYINVDDVVLNKTRNKTAQIAKSQAKVISIDSKPPQLTVKAMNDTDGDGYIETISLGFDEKLRPGMLNDLDIWKITDVQTLQILPVVNAELSEDYMTVVLTIAPFAYGTTTAPMMLKVEYNSQNALMDWTGNPVDMRLNGSDECVFTEDNAAPRVLHTGVKFAESTELYSEDYIIDVNGLFFRDRNDNGRWDEGEDIWMDGSQYGSPAQRVWNGGNAWTTPLGYDRGRPLAGVKATDADRSGDWNRGEFIWIDVNADGFFTDGEDVQIPQNRIEEIAVLDIDGNGFIDTIRVQFSEYVRDETMDGYMADRDSYQPGSWSIEDYTGLVALRSLDDITNDNIIYFRFNEAAVADTGVVPKFTLQSGETLEDMMGNVLENGMGMGNLVLADHAKPVVIAAISDDRVSDDHKLLAGTTITLTFSEPLVIYQETSPASESLTAAFSIESAGTKIPFTSDNSRVEVKENQIVIMVTKDIEDLPTKDYELTVKDLPDGVLGDAAGNSLKPLSGFEVPTLNSADQLEFRNPCENKYIRSNSDGLAVQIHFGDYEPTHNDITEWKLQLLANDEELDAKEGIGKEGLYAFAETDTDVDFSGWAISGQYSYQLKLTMTIGGRERVFTCNFFYSAEDDVYDAGEGAYVFDGAKPGVDVDQVLMADSALSANWLDFAAANMLHAADHYKVTFLRDGEMFCESGKISECAYTRTDVILTINARYKAVVEAFDKDNVKLAVASSNGMTAVMAISDTKAPEMVFVNDGLGADIDVTPSMTTLSANWEAKDDISTQSAMDYSYRIVRDFASSSWTPDKNQMSSYRSDYGYATLNGKVYVFGGSFEYALNSVEYFDPANRTWTLAPQSMQKARYGFAYVKVSEQEIIVAGGLDNDGAALDTIEYYNGSYWQTLKSLLPKSLYYAKAVAIDSDRVWIIGGYDDFGEISTDIYELNLNDGLVVPVSSMSTRRSGFTATLQRRSNGPAVVIACGRDEKSVASDIIDIVSVSDGSVVQRHLTNARDYHAAVAVPNGDDTLDEVWFIGGYDNDYQILASVEAIEPSSIVKELASLQVGRADLAAMWLPDAAKVLVAGGKMVEGSDATSVEYADSVCEKWNSSQGISLASGRSNFSMAVAQKLVVLFGGFSQSGTYTNETESRSQVETLTDWSAWKKGTTSVTVDGLSLKNGERYSFEVKARDEGGNVSSVMASNGVIVDKDSIMATMTCATWPETDGGRTLNQDFVVTVAGTNVDQYAYSLNGANYSAWIPVSTPISLTACEDGDYVLNVCGRNSATGSAQAEENASRRSWTVEAPVIEIKSGLPADGALTLDYSPVVVLGGNGIDVYDYELFKAAVGSAEWESIENGSGIPIAQSLTFARLDQNRQYKLTVVGRYQTRVSKAVSRTWTIAESGLEPVFNPALPEIAAVREYSFTVRDKSGLSAIDKFKYVVKDATGSIIAGGDKDEFAMSAAITLDLKAGAYSIGLKAHSISLGDWMPDYEFTTITLAAVTFDAESYGPSTQNTYDVAVNLNGLVSYNYQLDDGSVIAAEGASVKIGPLSAGTHVFRAWGKDSAGQEQTVATELPIHVSSVIPVGDKFTATVKADVSEQPYLDEEQVVKDVVFTVSFNDRLMQPLESGMLTATNGTVKSVTTEEDGLSFSVLVTPAPVTGGSLVTLAINANKVYSVTTGNGNTAASGTVLVFARKLLDFAVKPVAADTDDELENVVKGQPFDLQIVATSDEGFMGGELIIAYDSDYYTCNLPYDEGGLEYDAEQVLSDDYQTGAFVEYVYEDPLDETSRILGVRLGGTRGAMPAQTSNLFATLSFTPIKESTDTEQAIKLEPVPETQGFVFWNLRNFVLPSSSTSVTYGETKLLIMPEPAAEVTIKAIPETVKDGESYTMYVNLTAPMDGEVKVTVSDGTYEYDLDINAGETSASMQVTAPERDYVIEEHKTVNWVITGVQPSANVTLGTPSAVAVTIQDQDLLDVTTLTLTAVGMDSDTPVEAVTEGESFRFKVQLPEGVTPFGAMTFAESLTGTAKEVIDFTFEGDLKILQGSNCAYITVHTIDNQVASNTKDIRLALNTTTIAGVGTFNLTGVSSKVDILDNDSDITFTVSPDELNEGGSFDMTVSLGEGIVAAEDISFAVSVDGDAVQNVDYEPLASALLIRAGEKSGTVTMKTIVNVNDLEDKIFVMTLNSMTIGKGAASALEDKSIAVTIKNEAARPGDFYVDGKVDINDLMLFLSYLDMKADPDTACMDFDKSGIIDFNDLIYFLSLMDTDTRGGSEPDTRAGETLYFSLEADKDVLEANDEFTLTVKCKANFTNYPIAGATVNVIFNSAALAFAGDKDNVAACVSKDSFSLLQNGKISTSFNGLAELGGTTLARTLGTDGKEFVVATIPMKLVNADADSVTIDLQGFNGSTFGNGANQGLTVQGGTLALSGDKLVIPVRNAQPAREFAMALDVMPASTRGTAELVFGMKAGASEAYSAADGDTLWNQAFPGAYSAYIELEGREELLKRDFRGIADSAVWTVSYDVPAAQAPLTFSWAAYATGNADYALPSSYYDIILTDAAGTEIDMRTAAVKTIKVSGSGSFKIAVSKHVDYKTVSYALNAGWNLIGITMDLADGEFDKFAGCTVVGFNEATQKFDAAVNVMEAGKAYWVKTASAKTIGLLGTVPESTAVTLAAGWNLVSPKKGETWNYVNPAIVYGGIADAWTWNSGALVRLPESAETIIPEGTGLWIYSGKAQTIWDSDVLPELPQASFDESKNEYYVSIDLDCGYALVFGMLSQATKAFNVDEFDSPLPPLPDGCTAQVMLSMTDATGIPGLSAGLVTDIRGIADELTSWTIAYKVQPGKQVKLDWSEAVLPAYYDITLSVDGADPMDMKGESKTFMLNGGTNGIEGIITVASVKSVEKQVQQYSLAQGWNIIGIPFDLDDAEFAKLSGYVMQRYDGTTESYIQDITVDDMKAGSAVWLYAPAAATVTLKGIMPETTGITVKEGWNLISPVYRAHQAFENPVAYDGIDQAWIWCPETGYEWLRENESIQSGQGVWFYSDHEQIIWQ